MRRLLRRLADAIHDRFCPCGAVVDIETLDDWGDGPAQRTCDCDDCTDTEEKDP